MWSCQTNLDARVQIPMLVPKHLCDFDFSTACSSWKDGRREVHTRGKSSLRKLGNEPFKETNVCILILSFDGVIHEYLTCGRKELTLAF